MKNFTLLALSAVCLVQCITKSSYKDPLLEKGVSLELATHRSEVIDSIFYRLFLDLQTNKKQIKSHVTISFDLKSNSKDLILDFVSSMDTVSHVVLNGSEVDYNLFNEHLIIRRDLINKGKNVIDIDFYAPNSALKGFEDFRYSLFVPDNSRRLFPCFDQPDLKARYILEILTPKDWEVMTASPMEKRVEGENSLKYIFKESDLLSSYLFSFVAGVFSDTTLSVKSGMKSRFMFRETDSIKINSSIKPIFQDHQRALNYLEKYTAYPYPYQKLDFVSLPGFPFGGMEHTGAIQYLERAVFLDGTATSLQRLRRTKLISHETAHMWFGNLVTMQWFDDVWLKEVFANFFADKIAYDLFPEIDHELAFALRHHTASYSIDRTQGTHPIKQKLENLNNAGSIYGSIIYHKAPIVMRQLERFVGEKRFQKGIQDYIKTFAHDNCDWSDLIQILDKQSSHDLEAWSESWVYGVGRPKFEVNIASDKSGRMLDFTVRQLAEDGSSRVWPQKFSIAWLEGDHVKTFDIDVSTRKTQVQEAIGLQEPDHLIWNSDGMGYGLFPCDVSTLKRVQEIPDEVSRLMVYVNAYENLYLGKLSAQSLFKLYVNDLKTEKNEFVLSEITSQLYRMYWNYLDEPERMDFQLDLQGSVLARLRDVNSPSIARKVFDLAEGTFHWKDGRDLLYDIWTGQTQFDSLTLNTDDQVSLAQHLAHFRHEKTDSILSQARESISHIDKIDRFDFINPFLSEDANLRRKAFVAFKELKNRKHERWVTQACRFYHHPLNQESAINELEMSLSLSKEIQKTGSIFFPTSWLRSTIGMYNNQQAFDMLENFKKLNQDLDYHLRLKLLQSSDFLFKRHVKKDS